jgi:FixJ family two-component response regulator
MRRAKSNSLVAVVDDDPRVLESLRDLLESAGHLVRTFASGQGLLDDGALAEIGCLITDIGMPDLDGFELQRIVNQKRSDLPVILITGRHEIAEQPQADRKWFFRKPFDGHALLEAVTAALAGKENPS